MADRPELMCVYPRHLVKRRVALKTLGLGTIALTLANCGITIGTSPAGLAALGKDAAPHRKTAIEMYCPYGGTFLQSWIQLATRFEQIQADIGVKITYAAAAGGGGSDNPRLFTAIAGNASPDLALLTPFSTPQWVELGIMTDLTAYFQRDGLTSADFWPAAWHDMTYKGRVWQLVCNVDPNFPFFWNKDLFEKAGLDPDKAPQTIDEVTEYAKKINQKAHGMVTHIGIVPWDTYGFSNAMFTWGWAFGGTFYDEQKQEVTPDNDYVVKALEWMVRYAQSIGGADKIAVSPPNLQLPAFSTGNVGMGYLVAASDIAIRQANPHMHIGVGLLPYQGPGATQPGAGSWLGGWGVFIPKGARNPDAAWEFLKWFSATADGTETHWRSSFGAPSGYRKTPVLDEMKHDPLMAPYYQTLVTAQHSRPAIPVGAFYAAQLEQLVQDAIYGKLTSYQALLTVKRNTMKEWERFKREFDI